MSKGWNGWYHVTANTYGTWLRGDRRGWRERHHRDHVEGDYKNPPKRGSGDRKYELSKRLMKRDPVHLSLTLRWIALMTIVATLVEDGMLVVVASLDDHHLHVLAKFPDHDPRAKIGWAKFYATKAVKEAIERAKAHGVAVGFDLELEIGQGIWAKRSKAEPITGRSHQYNATEYIYDHIDRGAAVYLHMNADRWIRERKKSKRRRA